MEVLVRNLDDLEDRVLVFLQRLFWRTPQLNGRYNALFISLILAVIP